MLNNRSLLYGFSLLVLLGCGSTPSQTSLKETTPKTTTDYYANVQTQSGQELHKALHDLIKGHKVYSYNAVYDILKDTDEDPKNPKNVILFYTGESRPKGQIVAMEDESIDGAKDMPRWNREHVWAKSQGFPKSGMAPYSDLHHLRPADVKLNSTRSNLFFAELPNGNDVPNAPGNKIESGNAFEPADAFKGDVARMILYMDVRYDGDATGEPELVVADNTAINRAEQSTQLAKFGNLKDLLRWHKMDPVDDMERTRNEKIYKYQQNRNPFIDHPEMVEKIWGNADTAAP